MQNASLDLGAVVLTPRAHLPYSLDTRSTNHFLRTVGLVRKGQVRRTRRRATASLIPQLNQLLAPASEMPDVAAEGAPEVISATAKVGVSGTADGSDAHRTVCQANHVDSSLPSQRPTYTPPPAATLPDHASGTGRRIRSGLDSMSGEDINSYQDSPMHDASLLAYASLHHDHVSHDASNVATVQEALQHGAPLLQQLFDIDDYATERAHTSAYVGG